MNDEGHLSRERCPFAALGAQISELSLCPRVSGLASSNQDRVQVLPQKFSNQPRPCTVIAFAILAYGQ